MGFDPWCESARALQDLMQIESQTSSTKPTSVPVNLMSSSSSSTQFNTNLNNLSNLNNHNLLGSSYSNNNNNNNNGHLNNLNHLNSLNNLAKLQSLQNNISNNNNTNSNFLSHFEFLQKQLLLNNNNNTNSKLSDLSLESLLYTNGTNSLNGLLLKQQQQPPPGFSTNTVKFNSSSSSSSSASSSAASSTSSSVNNSASSTPSINNNNSNSTKNGMHHVGGSLHNTLKSIFPNANISFGAQPSSNGSLNNHHNLGLNSQTNNKLQNLTNNYWPDDPAIISLTDNVNNGIGSLSEFNSLHRALSPSLLSNLANLSLANAKQQQQQQQQLLNGHFYDPTTTQQQQQQFGASFGANMSSSSNGFGHLNHLNSLVATQTYNNPLQSNSLNTSNDNIAKLQQYLLLQQQQFSNGSSGLLNTQEQAQAAIQPQHMHLFKNLQSKFLKIICFQNFN